MIHPKDCLICGELPQKAGTDALIILDFSTGILVDCSPTLFNDSITQIWKKGEKSFTASIQYGEKINAIFTCLSGTAIQRENLAALVCPACLDMLCSYPNIYRLAAYEGLTNQLHLMMPNHFIKLHNKRVFSLIFSTALLIVTVEQ